jgi:hypothetical protein
MYSKQTYSTAPRRLEPNPGSAASGRSGYVTLNFLFSCTGDQPYRAAPAAAQIKIIWAPAGAQIKKT